MTEEKINASDVPGLMDLVSSAASESATVCVRIEGELNKEEYANPDWDKNRGRDWNWDWRDYVGARTRAIWHTFTDEQKEAIALDANDQSEEAWARAPL